MTHALPLGLIATWAMIGVVAAVIIVRLRDDDFGLRTGAALFVLGGVALAALCMAVRHERGRFGEVDGFLRNSAASDGTSVQEGVSRREGNEVSQRSW